MDKDSAKVNIKFPDTSWKALLVLLLFLPPCLGPCECSGEPAAQVGCKGAVRVAVHSTGTSTTTEGRR